MGSTTSELRLTIWPDKKCNPGLQSHSSPFSRRLFLYANEMSIRFVLEVDAISPVRVAISRGAIGKEAVTR
jgi:hypothetical protein